jgi:hypothetical protein
MSKPVFVRSVKPDEGKIFLDWVRENPVNEFDPDVALFPSSITWCAYDKDGPLAYQTVQRPLMLESLAPRPGATKQQVASALKELTQNAVTQAGLSGAGEIYFLGSDSATSEFATNHIFEEVKMKVYRVKIKDLE